MMVYSDKFNDTNENPCWVTCKNWKLNWTWKITPICHVVNEQYGFFASNNTQSSFKVSLIFMNNKTNGIKWNFFSFHKDLNTIKRQTLSLA